MSLSVTAVVQAAGGATEAVVVAHAARLLGAGLRFGDEVPYAAGALEALSAAYVGLVLVEGTAAPPSGDPAAPDSVDVCASRVWSETPLYRSADGRVLTHGELVSWAAAETRRGDPAPWWPQSLTAAVSSLFRAP